MIKTKTILTTSGLILVSAFAGVAHSYWETPQPVVVNYTGFYRLAENLSSLRTNQSTEISPRSDLTEQIVDVIQSELGEKINGHQNTLAKAIANQQTAKRLNLRKFGHIRVEDYQVSENGEKTAKEDDVSRALEINNAEMIDLKPVDRKSTMVLKKFEGTFESSLLKDEVETNQSSTKVINAPIEADEVKTIQHATKKEAEAVLDDLVIYDYSKNKNQSMNTQPKSNDKRLSLTVQKTISREMGQSNIKAVNIAHNDLKKELELSDEATIYDYSLSKSNSHKYFEEDSKFQSESQAQANTYQIKTKQLFLDAQKAQWLNGFEFVPDFDRTERMSDDTTGEIKLEQVLSGEGNVQTGVISARGVLPTRVELNLNTQKGSVIPLINEQSIQRFLQSQSISIEGNLILLSMHSEIKDVEIDSQYQKKFWFDKNLKELPGREKAELLMIAGVKTGNIMLRYLLEQGEIAQKLIFVGEGEAYFEDPAFEKSSRQTFELFAKNILSSTKKELSIDPGKLVFFNTNLSAKKRALNAYELKIPALPVGMRKYLDLKIYDEAVFVGVEHKSQIEIPTREYIEKILEKNQVSSLKDRCVVQINLGKELREIKAAGKNRSGEMFLEVSSMDRDGVFTSDNVELAEKVFLVGDQEGLVNARLEYTDGSSEFLKTYCSEGTYLIEQL